MSSIITMFAYLGGNRKAIRAIAHNRWWLLVGFVLVITGGMARNYDHLDLLRDAEWFLGPILVSVGSSLFIFLFCWWILRLGEGGKPFGRIYLSWLTLFWMTAPCAWIYALPVERWMDLLTATKWNFFFLLLVSVWRVGLMAWVLSVLAPRKYWHCLVAVLLPCSIEMGLAAAGKFMSRINMDIAAGMGGLRLPPTHSFLQSISFLLVAACILILLVTLPMSFVIRRKLREKISNGGKVSPTLGLPIGALLLGLAAVALGVHLVKEPQKSVGNTRALIRLLKTGDLESAAAFVEERTLSDFSPIHPIPPDPWGQESHRLLELLGQLNPEMDSSLLEVYLARVREEVESDFRWGGAPKLLLAVVPLSRFVEGRQIIMDNREAFEEVHLVGFVDVESFGVTEEEFKEAQAKLKELWVERSEFPWPK